MSVTIRQMLEQGRKLLCPAGVDSPQLSIELIIAYVLQIQRFELHLDIDRFLTAQEADSIYAMLKRRAQGEPVAYLLGSREFYGLNFSVGPDVLIPRPETEHIIEQCEHLFAKDEPFTFADLGTGSGILAVTLATLFPCAQGVAVDLQAGALALAKANAVSHSVFPRLQFVQGSFLSPLFQAGCFDLVVSNPPYVTFPEYEACSHEVRDFEPQCALTSENNGLRHIEELVPHASRMLCSGGRFIMEFGYQQGHAVQKIVADSSCHFREISIYKDLAGHERLVVAQKQ